MRWVLLVVASVVAASPVAAIDDQQSCLKANAEDARIEACSRALQAKPDDAIAYYNRGATYKLKGDFDRAIADFSKAIELKPDYAAAYDARGLVHVAKGDYVQALADVATIAILQERNVTHAEALTEQLQGALNSRIVIEQAKGAIAQRHDISIDAAFTALRAYARRHNRKLTEVAQTLLDDKQALTRLLDT